jgi:hypothetical protein
MGTGPYQGTVVDIRCYHNSTLIHTSQGTVWTCVNSTGNSYAEHGWGINLVATVGTGLNVFKQVPVPSVVVSVQSSSENASTANTTQYTVLTDEGRVYNWGGVNMGLDENSVKHAAYEIPISMYRQGTPKTNSQVDIMSITSKLTSITTGTATANNDAGTSTVTFSVPYVGTQGVLDTSGWTITMPDGTVSGIQTPLYLNTASGTLTFTATVASTDDPALSVPSSRAQTYTLNAGSLTATITGSRLTDAIAGKLTTSLAAYGAASAGSIVSVTAAEYAAIATLTGATRYACSDTTLALASTAWTNANTKIGVAGAAIAGQSAPFVPTGTYPLAYKVKAAATTTVPAGAFRFESMEAPSATALWTNAIIVGDNSPAVSMTIGQFSHFVIKAPASATTTQSAFVIDQNTQLFTAVYNAGAATSGSQRVSIARPRTAMTTFNSSTVPQYQVLGTTTKQW